MSAMYRLKAYFGMVPVEEMGDYPEERYADRSGTVRDYAADHDRVSRARTDSLGRTLRRRRGRGAPTTGTAAGPVGSAGRRGAHPGAVPGAARAGVGGRHRAGRWPSTPTGSRLGRSRAQPAARAARVAPGRGQALSRITTLQPSSYNEARTIGERYRDGQPVIINLTELDDAAAKRLVDFAAGLAFALRGSIDKVTSRVFLLTPADVEVSADDARKLAERTVGGTRAGGGTVGWRPLGARGDRVEERGIFRQD